MKLEMICFMAVITLTVSGVKIRRRSTLLRRFQQHDEGVFGLLEYIRPRQEVAYRSRPSSNFYNLGFKELPDRGYDDDDQERYRFAYRVRARGAPKHWRYGSQHDPSFSQESSSRDDNDDRHSKQYYSSAEFGHSEAHDSGKTTGAYFVQLPDGRTQRVDYYVEGDSGYVARVSYSLSSAAGERSR